LTRFTTLRAAGVAMSLSLSLLAGCAAPMVAPAPDATGTTPVTPTGTAAAPAAQPAAQPVAPAMPAPAAATATTLSGTASFRGELLSGYAVQVLDAQTGEPVALKDDLAGVSSLAVLNRNLVTDAKGQFSLQVVGLSAGQALLVVATKNNVRVEAVVTSNMQSLGAKGYKLAQAGTAFTLTELTTAIAKVARGVLTASQVLTPEAAAPVIAKLATQMSALSAKFETALSANPNFANELITAQGGNGDAAVKTLVGNAGQLQSLTAAIAGLVGDIATAAKAGTSPAAAEAAVQAKLAKIDFVGTVLAGAFANNGFTLTNGVNGNSIDATAANFGTVTSQVTRPSSGSRRAAPVGVPVSNGDEFRAALYDESVTAIYFTQDIDLTQNNTYRVLNHTSIWRPISIDGQNFELSGNRELEIASESENATPFVLKNIRFTTYLELYSPATVQNCTFTVSNNPGIILGFAPTAAAISAISGNTFIRGEYDSSIESGRYRTLVLYSPPAIDCRFLDGPLDPSDESVDALMISEKLKSANTFDAAFGENKVRFSSIYIY
jgi:hypothetical protein